MKTRFKAYMELTLAMFIAGSSVVASKLLVQTLPVFLSSECSLIIASIILSLLTFKNKEHIPKINVKILVVLFLQAITGVFLFRVFLFFGLKFTSAIESGLITSASPAMIGLLSLCSTFSLILPSDPTVASNALVFRLCSRWLGDTGFF